MPGAKYRVKDHILELRKRIIAVAFFFALFFGISLWKSPLLVRIVRERFLQPDVSVLAITPPEVFSAYISTALYAALMLTVPVIVYEKIAFLLPAVKKKERKGFVLLALAATLLFALGMLFAYFVLVPLALRFFSSLGSEAGIWNAWSIKALLGFVFGAMLYTGLAFEMPVAVFILKKLGIVKGSPAKWRRQAYVLILFLAAAITPPDVASQIILALPMIALYEVSVLVGKGSGR